MSLDMFLLILVDLPLVSKLLIGLVPVDLSIPMLNILFMVGNMA